MKPVSGYTDQPDTNVDIVNMNKQIEELVLQMIDGLGGDVGSMNVDKRWLAIARTNIEQGFMALNRAVFCPQRVPLTITVSQGAKA